MERMQAGSSARRRTGFARSVAGAGLLLALCGSGLAFAGPAAAPAASAAKTRQLDLYPCSTVITTDSSGKESSRPACTTEKCVQQCAALRQLSAQRSRAAAGVAQSMAPAPQGAASVHPALPPPPPSSPAVTAPNPPVLLNSCDAGGCWGSDAQRYSGGDALINKQGRLCTKTGAFVQCF